MLPGRCEELSGERAGTFSVRLDKNYRLIFGPAHEPIPSSRTGVSIGLASLESGSSKWWTIMARPEAAYQPTTVSPPGRTLADLLEERGMSQAELARRMGRPEKTISEIVNGKAAITPETALQLESVFDVPAGFWIAREANYREFLARSKQDRTLQKHRAWARLFPLREMRKRGWIDQKPDPGDEVREVLGYFSVASPKQWTTCTRDYQAAHRAHRSAAQDSYALAAWLQAGRLLCTRRRTPEFDEGRLRNGLERARAWTRLEPREGLARATTALEAAGVVVAIVPELPGCRVSGATMWVGGRRAVLQLSLRYRTDDQLWFTFFHEAAHLLLHSRKSIFLEADSPSTGTDREAEADRWAREHLIPADTWEAFVERGVITASAISEFADSISIAPGIVVGRLQHEGRVPWSSRNGLKRRLSAGALESRVRPVSE